MAGRTPVAICLLALLPPLLCLPLLTGMLTADPEVWTSHLAFTQPGADLLLRGYPGWADGNAGVTTEALGGLAAQDWLHGRIPWWNPYSGVGMPLAAEQQNSALFLPFVLLLAAPNGVLLLKLALEVVAGLACFGLLRTLGLSRTVALAGGILAECNGTFAWYAHGPIMPVAFLPMLLWGIERCRRAGGFGAPIVAVAVAMSLLAGFPETAYLDGLLALVWFAARLAAMPGWRAACRFAGTVAAGGACGLLLASPALVTFLASLPVSYLGQHTDFDRQHLLRPNLLMLLLPYAYGPILFDSESGAGGPEIWWHAGGFIGLPLALAALRAALSAGRGVRERGLRWALAAWLLATGAKAVGWPPAVAAFDLLPFVRQSMFYVYILPSWEIACIVLAALCLHDAGERRLARSTTALAGAIAAAALAGALALSWPWLARLARHAHDVLWAAWLPSAAELLLGAAFLAAIAASGHMPLAARDRTPVAARGRAPVSARSRATPAIAALLAAAILDATFPLVSAAPPRPLDLAPLAWLRAHLGQHRFYSEYLLQPNTAARYRVASVNHIALPVPRDWVDYLHAHLNPAMDGTTFFGNDLHATETGDASLAGVLHPPASIAQAVAALEELSVRYVVVPKGVDPFADTAGAALDLAARQPFPLTGDSTATATIALPALREQNVTQVGLQLGTYGGHAAGVVVATLCAGNDCATARIEAATAADNAVAWTNLDHALPVHAAGAVTLAVHAEGPPDRPALWRAPRTDPDRGLQPVAVLRFRAIAEPVRPAYRDLLVDIFPLADPAPYVGTAAGHCRLAPLARDRIAAFCTAPDTLVRRELFAPGWRARVGAEARTVERTRAIFQAVRLSAGASVVTFSYHPPGEALIAGALALGTLLLGALVLGGLGVVRPGAACRPSLGDQGPTLPPGPGAACGAPAPTASA